MKPACEVYTVDMLSRIDVGKESKHAGTIKFAAKADPELLTLAKAAPSRFCRTPNSTWWMATRKARRNWPNRHSMKRAGTAAGHCSFWRRWQPPATWTAPALLPTGFAGGAGT